MFQFCDSLFSSMQRSQIIVPVRHSTDESLRPVEHSKFDDARRAKLTAIAPPAGDMDTAFVDSSDGNGGSDGNDGNLSNDGNGGEINTETGSPITTSVVLRLQHYIWFDVVIWHRHHVWKQGCLCATTATSGCFSACCKVRTYLHVFSETNF